MDTHKQRIFQPKTLYDICVNKISRLAVRCSDVELSKIEPYLPEKVMDDVILNCLHGERNLKLIVLKTLGLKYKDYMLFVNDDDILVQDMFNECMFKIKDLLDNIPYCFYEPLLAKLLLDEDLWDEYLITVINCEFEEGIGEWDWSSLTPDQSYALKYYPNRAPYFCDEFVCVVSSKYSTGGSTKYLCGNCCQLQPIKNIVVHVTEVLQIHSENLIEKYFRDPYQWCSLCHCQPLFELLVDFNENVNKGYHRIDIIPTKTFAIKRRKIETRPKKYICTQ
ncbi:DiNV CH01M ORF38-like protein [Mauternbach virus]|uniref:DiNV CH01M ORF38-like protein n=1 Tax=Mauternbach virus TaxID=2486603 RepID=A0A3G3E647_9VIRU|nr:DiNV CH01M ORF38-like protein [Mauternbach virus]AYP97949.1 DiNV CH01M ORF38-like protein [Mauternbach virus]